MNSTKVLILKELATQRLTVRDLADLIGVTTAAIQQNIKQLKEMGHYLPICGYEKTPGRGRPIYKLSNKNIKDLPEPNFRKESQTDPRKYLNRSALISRRSKQKRSRFVATPWDGFGDIARERARN